MFTKSNDINIENINIVHKNSPFRLPFSSYISSPFLPHLLSLSFSFFVDESTSSGTGHAYLVGKQARASGVDFHCVAGMARGEKKQ